MSMNFNIRLVVKIIFGAILFFILTAGKAQDLRDLERNCDNLLDIIVEYLDSERIENFNDPKNKQSIFHLAKMYMLRSQFCNENEWQRAIDVLDGILRSETDTLLVFTPLWGKNEKLTKTFLQAICYQKLENDITITLYDTLIKKDVPISLAIFNKSIILLNDSSWASVDPLLSSLLRGDDHSESTIFPKDSHKYPIFRDNNFIDDAQFLLACSKYYKHLDSLDTNKQLRMKILAEFAKIERFYPGSDLANFVERQKTFNGLIDFANGRNTEMIENLFKAYMETLKNGLVSKQELTNNYRN